MKTILLKLYLTRHVNKDEAVFCQILIAQLNWLCFNVVLMVLLFIEYLNKCFVVYPYCKILSFAGVWINNSAAGICCRICHSGTNV